MPNARPGPGLVLPFAAMAALVFGLTSWLYLYKLEHTLTQVEESRLRFTLADLRADFEKGLDRGFTLDRLPNAQAAIDTEARQDPDLEGLAVLDARGARVWRTGSAPDGAVVGGPEFVRTPDSTLGWAPLVGNDGARAGALALRYTNRAHAAIVRALAWRLSLAALAATLVTSAGYFLALRRLLRRRDRLFAQATTALGAARMPAATDPALARMIDHANQNAATALVELTAARHAIVATQAGRAP
jgi:hypothetical protein